MAARKAKPKPPRKPPKRTVSKQDVILVLSNEAAAILGKVLEGTDSRDYSHDENEVIDTISDEIIAQLSRDDKKK